MRRIFDLLPFGSFKRRFRSPAEASHNLVKTQQSERHHHFNENNMRVLIWTSLLLSGAWAFQPVVQPKKTLTKLHVQRRDVLVTLIGAAAMAPGAAHALSHGIQNRQGSHTHGSTWFFDEQIENVHEESQQDTGGKLDLNGATVVRTSSMHDRRGFTLSTRVTHQLLLLKHDMNSTE